MPWGNDHPEVLSGGVASGEPVCCFNTQAPQAVGKMPPKKKNKKPNKSKGKEKAVNLHERSRIPNHSNELLRLGQTSTFATNKQVPHRFLQYLRAKGGLNDISISVREVGSRVVLTPGVYARGPGHGSSADGGIDEGEADGPAVENDKEITWRRSLCPAHVAVMSALDSSGVSRMLDVSIY